MGAIESFVAAVTKARAAGHADLALMANHRDWQAFKDEASATAGYTSAFGAVSDAIERDAEFRIPGWELHGMVYLTPVFVPTFRSAEPSTVWCRGRLCACRGAYAVPIG